MNVHYPDFRCASPPVPVSHRMEESFWTAGRIMLVPAAFGVGLAIGTLAYRWFL